MPTVSLGLVHYTASTLLISQEPSFRERIGDIVASVGDCNLEVFTRFEDAVPRLIDSRVALVIVHLTSSDDGDCVAVLLREAAATRSHVATVVVSDDYLPDRALETMRLGAADYLCAQRDMGRLKFLIDLLTMRVRIQGASWQKPAPTPVEDAQRAGLVFAAAFMTELMERVRLIASQDTHVLLRGETGTGKTRLARFIHDASRRADKPFLIVNCATLSPSLTESELFGHCKGAFTGADQDRAGKFADVKDGTLLLDDVDTLSLEAQAKLLRVVDERVFEPVGSNRSQEMQARLIAATNRILEDEVAAGRFRRDLYYRLNVIEIRLPPLRERVSEIRTLAEHFVLQTAARTGRAAPRLNPEVIDALESYPWSGNIRELRNVVERSVVLTTAHEIRLCDLPDGVQGAALQRPSSVTGDGKNRNDREEASPVDSPVVSSQRLSVLAKVRIQAEIKRIVEALEKNGQNRSRTADELGISRVALYKKLHRFGLMES